MFLLHQTKIHRGEKQKTVLRKSVQRNALRWKDVGDNGGIRIKVQNQKHKLIRITMKRIASLLPSPRFLYKWKPLKLVLHQNVCGLATIRTGPSEQSSRHEARGTSAPDAFAAGDCSPDTPRSNVYILLTLNNIFPLVPVVLLQTCTQNERDLGTHAMLKM